MKTKTQKLYDRMAKWNFKLVRDRVKKEIKVSEVEARNLQREYVRFMVLSTTLNSAPMFPAVDEFWHAHILHTEDYRAFCLALNGSFIDHRPNTGKEDPKEAGRAYRAFRKAYRAEFGPIDAKYWPSVGTAHNCQCGASNCSGTNPGPRCRTHRPLVSSHPLTPCETSSHRLSEERVEEVFSIN